jgi:hypothetical protein
VAGVLLSVQYFAQINRSAKLMTMSKNSLPAKRAPAQTQTGVRMEVAIEDLVLELQKPTPDSSLPFSTFLLLTGSKLGAQYYGKGNYSDSRVRMFFSKIFTIRCNSKTFRLMQYFSGPGIPSCARDRQE